MANASERIAAGKIGDGDALPLGGLVHDAIVAPGAGCAVLLESLCRGVQNWLPFAAEIRVFLERLDEHGDLVDAGESRQRGGLLAAGPFVLGEVTAVRPDELSERLWHRGTFRRGGLSEALAQWIVFPARSTNTTAGRPFGPKDAIRNCLIRGGRFWSDGMALSPAPFPLFEGSLDSPRPSFTPRPSWLVRHWPRVGCRGQVVLYAELA
jgi:hypothetical protein